MRTTGFLLTYNARKGTPMLDGLEGEEINGINERNEDWLERYSYI